MVHRFGKCRGWKMWGWACVLFLLLVNSAQVIHSCGLPDELNTRPDRGVSVSSASTDHSFCMICVSSHSPSLASPFVYLFSVDGSAGMPLPARNVQRSVAPVFVHYIRPPPVA